MRARMRLGWIAATKELIETVSIHRDYDTISVGMINDHFATMALENSEKVLARSQAITRGNLAVLSDWVAEQPLISWVKPSSGTTALLKVDLPMTSRDLCIDLLKETGVMFTLGSALNMEGYVRIALCKQSRDFEKGIETGRAVSSGPFVIV